MDTLLQVVGRLTITGGVIAAVVFLDTHVFNLPSWLAVAALIGGGLFTCAFGRLLTYAKRAADRLDEMVQGPEPGSPRPPSAPSSS